MCWEQLLAWVCGKVDQQLQLKIEYLAAENRILRSQVPGRVCLSDGQRITLAFIGKKLSRKAIDDIASVVIPETILRWHRQLVARKFDASDRRKDRAVGRPPTDLLVVEQLVAIARANPTWGYRRIAGAMIAMGHELSHQTVKNLLEDRGIDPSPTRKGKTSWSDFIKTHTDCLHYYQPNRRLDASDRPESNGDRLRCAIEMPLPTARPRH